MPLPSVAPSPSENATLSNSTTTTTTVDSTLDNDYHHSGISLVGVIVLACFTVAVNVLFFGSIYLKRRRRRLRAVQDERDAGRHFEMDDDAEQKLRFSNIESWVFCKTILPHDELCDKLQPFQTSAKGQQRRRVFTKQRTSTVETALEDDEDDIEAQTSPSSSEDGADDDGSHMQIDDAPGRECSICFDNLEPGDIASWSLDPACNHIFHHKCIKQWLLKNQNCPFCRVTFLPIDDTSVFSDRIPKHRSGTAMQQVGMLLMAHNERSKPCFCCEEHGIVDIPRSRPASISTEEWESLAKRGAGCPSREELRNLRGETTHDEEVTNNNEEIDEEEDEENDNFQVGGEEQRDELTTATTTVDDLETGTNASDSQSAAVTVDREHIDRATLELNNRCEEHSEDMPFSTALDVPM